MSDFDNNQNNDNEQENSVSEENKSSDTTQSQDNSSDNRSQQDFRQSSDSANANNGYPYNYSSQQQNNNGYYNNNNNQQYGYNNQPYGNRQNGYYGNNFNRSPNYVYYGNQQYNSNGAYNPQGANSSYNNQSQYNQQSSSEQVSKHSNKGKVVFAVIVVLIVVVSIVLIALSANGKLGSSKSNTTKVDGPTLSSNDSPITATTSADGELTAAGVYEKVKGSSVGVLVYSSNTTTAASEGSGVIVGVDNSGTYSYILTCAHVVSGGGSIVIQLYDETKYDATLIGYDSKTDIAVLRIKASGLTVCEIGNSDSLSVGETVYAIGNPGGVDFAGSFTNGMVSAIARPINSEIGYEMNCIQHTAAINPGNSGGALVNAYGQIVGINSSKISSTDYEGMGFAVPSSTFIDVYNEIIAHGYVTNRPKLGITYTPASASQSYSMLVGAKGLPTGSLIVKSIDADSSLANTNVQVGDLITKVNGKNLDSADTLPDLIEQSKVGDKLTLSICHFDNNYQATEFDIEVTLVEDKGTTAKVAVETTTQNYSYNPFGTYGYGN